MTQAGQIKKRPKGKEQPREVRIGQIHALDIWRTGSRFTTTELTVALNASVDVPIDRQQVWYLLSGMRDEGKVEHYPDIGGSDRWSKPGIWREHQHAPWRTMTDQEIGFEADTRRYA